MAIQLGKQYKMFGAIGNELCFCKKRRSVSKLIFVSINLFVNKNIFILSFELMKYISSYYLNIFIFCHQLTF